MTIRKNSRLRLKVLGGIAIAALAVATTVAPKALSQGINNRNGIRRVLLISIDGMHALDYENCKIKLSVQPGACPNLAVLGTTGVNYTRTSTSKPSDSAPGLAALVSGGTPRSTGIYYDVAYDRVLAPPKRTTGNGVVGSLEGVPGVPQCIPNGVPVGTTTEYEEGVD